MLYQINPLERCQNVKDNTIEDVWRSLYELDHKYEIMIRLYRSRWYEYIDDFGETIYKCG